MSSKDCIPGVNGSKSCGCCCCCCFKAASRAFLCLYMLSATSSDKKPNADCIDAS